MCKGDNNLHGKPRRVVQHTVKKILEFLIPRPPEFFTKVRKMNSFHNFVNLWERLFHN